jgi:hypothetical protein
VINNNKLIEIGYKMIDSGLPIEFIVVAVNTALEFEGVYDLMQLWAEEEEPPEREKIIADIKELIDDCDQKEKLDGYK